MRDFINWALSLARLILINFDAQHLIELEAMRIGFESPWIKKFLTNIQKEQEQLSKNKNTQLLHLEFGIGKKAYHSKLLILRLSPIYLFIHCISPQNATPIGKFYLSTPDYSLQDRVLIPNGIYNICGSVPNGYNIVWRLISD